MCFAHGEGRGRAADRCPGDAGQPGPGGPADPAVPCGDGAPRPVDGVPPRAGPTVRDACPFLFFCNSPVSSTFPCPKKMTRTPSLPHWGAKLRCSGFFFARNAPLKGTGVGVRTPPPPAVENPSMGVYSLGKCLWASASMLVSRHFL